MADDNFRSYRNRDALARDEAERTANDAADPLAELARLIGQTDPHAADRYAGARRPEAYHPAPSGAEVEAERDWGADEVDADHYDDAEDRYAPPAPAPAPPPAGGRYFAGPAAQFNGFREEPEADYRGGQMPALRSEELPAYSDAGADEGYEADEHSHAGGEDYASDKYYEEPASPRRRSGLVAVMAVLALIVVGTAGAFGYRAMFGGSMLPSLPPIIKASNGPNKIVPSYGEAQANNPGPTGVPSVGSTEHLVSREEQPVNVEPPTTTPRVVSTIPIASGDSLPPGTSGAPAALASTSPWPNSPTQAPAWPNPPAPAVSSPNHALPMPAAAQTVRQSPASTEPKRIHTVVIRSDPSGASDAAPAAPLPQQAAALARPETTQPSPPRAVARPAPAPRHSAATSAPPVGSSAPLSIVPGGRSEAAAPPVTRVRASAAPMAVASAGPVSGMAAAPSSGGYAVQVTSQRSEAEAQAAFRELRSKFPKELSGRQPIIRRADLGAKGTYYRALVGPFASATEAAGLCSGLKAAGGNCLVQRN
jgi:hypothetical protein